MRFSVIICAVVLCISYTYAAQISEEVSRTSFEEFIQKFGKEYSSDIEREARYGIFRQTLNMVTTHNEAEDSGKGRGFRLGIMPWSDLTKEERKTVLHHSYKKSALLSTEFASLASPALNANPPDEVDWRTRGAVTEIKNQGQCGSSPHFGVVTAAEGAYAIHQHKLVSLSAQQLVDCSPNPYGSGCNGADFQPIFKYILVNGSCTAAAYPYKGVSGTCQTTCKPITNIFKAFKQVPQGQENTGMLSAVAAGPVACAVNAGDETFEYYESGIYSPSQDECTIAGVDHGIAVVGYGFSGFAAPTTPFWILKNSWTTEWGEDGFMRLFRGNNTCGIATSVFYVW